MSIFRYLKECRWDIMYFFTLMLTIDAVLYASTTLTESVSDILYMNVLLAAVSIIYLVVGYIRWKAAYGELFRLVKGRANIEESLKLTDSFASELIREIIIIKNDEMNHRVDSVQNSLDEMSDFITKWTHEIKIPISVCELIAERISEHNEDEAICSVSRDMKSELQRIRFLVDQVLYSSRAAGYAEDLLINEIGIESVVKDILKKNAYFFIKKRIAVNLGNLNYLVMTDRKWITYILEQIINNAVKYCSENGTIDIRAYEDDRSIRLAIKDNGIGISPEDIRRVFDRGFTGENGRLISKSTGMGLYFSKKMADKLGHAIEISSQTGAEHYTQLVITFYKLKDYFSL